VAARVAAWTVTVTATADVALREAPAFIPAGDETIFGVLTAPPPDHGDIAVVVLGGGLTPSTSTGRNRVFVTMCRQLADAGFPAFRFDYHSLGESTGAIEDVRLDKPHLEDLRAAIGWMRDLDVERFILVGSCFGARTALSLGPEIDGLAGVVLLGAPLRDYGISERKTAGWGVREYLLSLVRPQMVLGGSERLSARRYLGFLKVGATIMIRRVRERVGAADRFSWVSRQFLEPLFSLGEKGVPVTFVYGTEDDAFKDFQEATGGRLGEVLKRSSPSMRVVTLPGRVHGFTEIEGQGAIAEVTTDCVRGLTADASAAQS
jgi:pimeloyl-ACP methyl ester carboxylesterase